MYSVIYQVHCIKVTFYSVSRPVRALGAVRRFYIVTVPISEYFSEDRWFMLLKLVITFLTYAVMSVRSQYMEQTTRRTRLFEVDLCPTYILSSSSLQGSSPTIYDPLGSYVSETSIIQDARTQRKKVIRLTRWTFDLTELTTWLVIARLCHFTMLGTNISLYIGMAKLQLSFSAYFSYHNY